MGKRKQVKRILIFGLPGSGKSTLSEKLVEVLGNADWHNADKIRETFNDWDFSPEGRERQSLRMRDYVRKSVAKKRYGIADFVCPTNQLREKNVPEYVIWMDTIKESNYKDTDKIFEEPEKFNLKISSWDQYSPKQVASLIRNV